MKKLLFILALLSGIPCFAQTGTTLSVTSPEHKIVDDLNQLSAQIDAFHQQSISRKKENDNNHRSSLSTSTAQTEKDKIEHDYAARHKQILQDLEQQYQDLIKPHLIDLLKRINATRAPKDNDPQWIQFFANSYQKQAGLCLDHLKAEAKEMNP